MRKLKYLILAVGTLFVIASCDDNIPQSMQKIATPVFQKQLPL